MRTTDVGLPLEELKTRFIFVVLNRVVYIAYELMRCLVITIVNYYNFLKPLYKIIQSIKQIGNGETGIKAKGNKN